MCICSQWVCSVDIGSIKKHMMMDTSEAQVHLSPSPGMNIKDPCVVQYFAVSILSSSYQQLGVVITKVEAAGCMASSWHRELPLDVKFTALLSGS